MSRRASREHKAEPWKKLLGVLSDKAQTLQYDRTFHSKQSHDFCFLILTVFGGENDVTVLKANFHFLLVAQKVDDFERTH